MVKSLGWNTVIDKCLLMFFSDVNGIWKLNGISMECSCFFLRVYIWDLNGFDGILMKKHVQSPYQLECMCINLGRNSES